MIKNTILFSFVLFLVTACQSQEGKQMVGNKPLVTESDSIFYAIGSEFTNSMTKGGISFHPRAFINGYLDCEAGRSYINENNIHKATEHFRGKFEILMKEDAPIGTIDSFSYAFGANQYFQMKNFGLEEVNKEALFSGVLDYAAGQTGQLDNSQVRQMLEKFNALIQKIQEEKVAEMSQANLKESQMFFNKLKKDDTVQSTPSGLKYKVITPGTGKQPNAESRVKVHYEGRLINGTIFDSSYQRGTPTEFVLNQVVKGWTEGVALMREGAKYELYVPAHLAYGVEGFPPYVGPNSSLIFVVELLEVM